MSLFVLSSGLFYLLLIFSLCFYKETVSVNNETDQLALLKFKSGIHSDPFGAMASWNNSIHFCDWYGVTCGGRHQRVTILDLSSHGLAGSISPHIGNLSFLKALFLRNNSLTGQIPSEVGRLRRLEKLVFANNSLAQEIPANLSSCINLKVIAFGYNHLSGPIPFEFGFLMNLEVLSLHDNRLTGSIPSSLGNLSSLHALCIDSNRLGGRIPYTLGQLKNLKEFALGDNIIRGTIPLSIFNLTSVVSFGVYQNQLHGPLPLDLGILFPKLHYFGIFNNHFNGPIPPSLSNASNIQRIFLAGNQFSGEVPNLDKLHRLEWLNINNNNLGSGREGDLRFLSTLSNATYLSVLSIAYNNFGGLLPHSLVNLSSTTLTQFVIRDNRINGTLPAGITRLESLQVLDAGSNQLSGIIPGDMGRLQSLTILQLDNNEFIGNIPPSMGNLTKLSSLLLHVNKLQGSIPSTLGNCQSLWQLNISYNNISGTIPPAIFTISSLSYALDLSMNKLTGDLPVEIGNLKNLGQFSVSENMLSGGIPSSLGSCVMLEGLYMSGNFFHGSIPPSFTLLRGLRHLNLSHNNLSGRIPNFFQSLHFQDLDLSFNNLSGSVPNEGIFKNASAVSVEGNKMLCGKNPLLHLPICLSGEPKTKRVTVKMKIIIGILLSSLVAFVIFIILMFLLPKKKSKGVAPSSSQNLLLQVSYEALYIATEGFFSTNLIGTGGFGVVYKGILVDPHRVVAVKVFRLQIRGASKSFIAECVALRNIRHRNLVKVITACSSVDSRGDDFKAIVYEFMSNGNLDQWLHTAAKSDGPPELTGKLNLLQRLSIAIDIACALDYLHHQYGKAPIVHCDLKPTNILLNSEMTAKVGDFGLTKFFSESTNNSATSTMGLRGTIGYAAPEYGTGCEVSTYGDVYSYGILLLEMFTATRPTDDMFNNDMNLCNYVKKAFPDQVAAIADPILVQEIHENCGGRGKDAMESLVRIFEIAIACSEESPRKRKTISDALAELILVKEKLVQVRITYRS